MSARHGKGGTAETEPVGARWSAEDVGLVVWWAEECNVNTDMVHRL